MKNTIITNDFNKYTHQEIRDSNLIIVINDCDCTFTIYKNRWGVNGKTLSLSFLSDVLKNPAGKLEYHWI